MRSETKLYVKLWTSSRTRYIDRFCPLEFEYLRYLRCVYEKFKYLLLRLALSTFFLSCERGSGIFDDLTFASFQAGAGKKFSTENPEFDLGMGTSSQIFALTVEFREKLNGCD